MHARMSSIQLSKAKKVVGNKHCYFNNNTLKSQAQFLSIKSIRTNIIGDQPSLSLASLSAPEASKAERQLSCPFLAAFNIYKQTEKKT